MRYITLLITLTIVSVVAYFQLRGQGQLAQMSKGFPGVPPAIAAKIAAATHSVAGTAPSTPDPARQEIDAQLKALKVTSIMPGDPGLMIVDKRSYAEGDDLPLGKGRKLRVTKVQEDGVLLAYNGQTFHLDAPAAPDLDAIRKPPAH